jgi:uncharacterized membrane protein (DUF485 family)
MRIARRSRAADPGVRGDLINDKSCANTGDKKTRRVPANAVHPVNHEESPEMSDSIVARIEANPRYHELKKKRNAFGWTLTILMLIVYFGYIALIAFNKPFLSTPIGNGVTTIGIPIGLGVIVFTIVITGIYVRRANSEFDALTREILEEASK